MNQENISMMIQAGELIPAETWDFHLPGSKDLTINHGMVFYIQSFYDDHYEHYQIRSRGDIHEAGKLVARLLPWFDAKKIWINKADRESTMRNDPEYIKNKKKQDKIKKTGSYEGPQIESII